MPNFNQATIVGHLGRDAETDQVGAGSKTRFSVACSRRWKDKATGEKKEATDWINVVAWNQIDFVREALVKGAAVLVAGSLRTDSYEAKDGSGKRTYTYVNADNIQLLGGKGDKQAVRDSGHEGGAFVDDSDVPF